MYTEPSLAQLATRLGERQVVGRIISLFGIIIGVYQEGKCRRKRP